MTIVGFQVRLVVLVVMPRLAVATWLHRRQNASVASPGFPRPSLTLPAAYEFDLDGVPNGVRSTLPQIRRSRTNARKGNRGESSLLPYKCLATNGWKTAERDPHTVVIY